MFFISWPFYSDWYFGRVFCVCPLNEGAPRTFLFDAAVYKLQTSTQCYIVYITNTYFKGRKPSKVVERFRKWWQPTLKALFSCSECVCSSCKISVDNISPGWGCQKPLRVTYLKQYYKINLFFKSRLCREIYGSNPNQHLDLCLAFAACTHVATSVMQVFI